MSSNPGNNPLDRIPGFDRVSIRAVVVDQGEDPSDLLSEAGILDPVSLPAVVGDDQPDLSFGDGIVPNLIAVLEPDETEDDLPASPAQFADTLQHDPVGQSPSAPASLPEGHGSQPLAPIRRR